MKNGWRYVGTYAGLGAAMFAAVGLMLWPMIGWPVALGIAVSGSVANALFGPIVYWVSGLEKWR